MVQNIHAFIKPLTGPHVKANVMRNLMLCLLVLCAQYVLGQESPRVNVRGTVFDNETLEHVEGAQVRLLSPSDDMVAGKLTAKNGQFLIPNVVPGSYTLRVSMVGYRDQQFRLTLPQRGGNYRVADVKLRADTLNMQEVVITAKMPELTVVDDTLMYNADAYKLQDGALVEELVKKLPGVTQDENGNFVFNGKPIQQILVDGKEFYGNDQQIVLKNLPAEIVQRVKAYEKQSDRARITGIDDGEERQVLDLQIKKDRKRGWMGNIAGGYGTEDRYSGRAMVNRFVGDQKFSVTGNVGNAGGNGLNDHQQGGASMNWQNQKLELNGNIGGRWNQGKNQTWNSSQNFENRNAAYSNSWNKSSNRNSNLNFGYKMEWRPDSTWNILFRPEASLSNSRSSSNSESATFTDDPYLRTDDPLADHLLLRDIGVNHRLGSNSNKNKNWNMSASVQINKRLGKPGRNLTLNLGGNMGRSTQTGENYSQVDYYQLLAYDGGDSVYHKTQFNHAPQQNRNWNIQLGYSEPIAHGMYLQLNYEYRHRWSRHERNVSSIFDWSNGLQVPDTAQMGTTASTYQNHNIRLQLRINRTRYQLTVGGSLQPQSNTVDYTKGWKHYDLSRSVMNVSPTLRFRYRFSRQETLDLRWNGRTGQPNITDLIPDTLSNADPLNIRLGNPELKPSFTQSAGFNYRRSVPELQRSSNLSLQANITQNATTNRTEYNDITGGRISKPVNINGNWSVEGNYNFNTALDAEHHWRINSDTRLRHVNSVGYVYQRATTETVKNTTKSTLAEQGLRLTYRQEWETEWSIEASVGGRGNYTHRKSTNTSASNLDTYHFNYGGNMLLQTPWGTSVGTDIYQSSRRGYTAQSMNTDQLIWNATISQRLLKGNRLTISLRAVDILNRRDDVSRNVSATARTDSRRQMVSSYYMLTVNYRFGKFGGRKGGQGGRERQERKGGEERRNR